MTLDRRARLPDEFFDVGLMMYWKRPIGGRRRAFAALWAAHHLAIERRERAMKSIAHLWTAYHHRRRHPGEPDGVLCVRCMSEALAHLYKKEKIEARVYAKTPLSVLLMPRPPKPT